MLLQMPCLECSGYILVCMLMYIYASFCVEFFMFFLFDL